jgi:hypothetical protein
MGQAGAGGFPVANDLPDSLLRTGLATDWPFGNDTSTYLPMLVCPCWFTLAGSPFAGLPVLVFPGLLQIAIRAIDLHKLGNTNIGAKQHQTARPDIKSALILKPLLAGARARGMVDVLEMQKTGAILMGRKGAVVFARERA